jgi:hypothetical protein
MVILIYDTNGGLCNQFYDIINGINFCLKYNIQFTFRYCAFRNDNLTSWTKQSFENLFDMKLFDKYDLYKNYHDIKENLTDDNCFNLDGTKFAYNVFNDNNNDNDIQNQIINLNKKYIVLKQFWSLYNFRNFIDNTIHISICPSKRIMDKYNEITNLIINKQRYNYIHYRYEKDFTNYFKINCESLDNLIEKIKFKNNGLNIYIATSNIKNLLNLKDNKYKNILYKNDDELLDFNFEERAFIDYMFGLNSIECFGHSKSSFSHMLNNIKKTNNFYDLL